MIGRPDTNPGSTVAALLSQEGSRTGSLRFLPMIGSSMAPTLRPGDFVGIAPVDGYSGPGIYAFERLGRPVLQRAEHIAGTGQIRVSHDNPTYSAFTVTVEQFNASVIGTAFALCSICEAGFILDALAACGEARA